MANCDGTNSGIISARSCTVPQSVLNATPYSLSIGATVIVQVEAQNAIGYSTPSTANTLGALAEYVPTQAPTLSRGSTTSESQVEIAWTAISTSPANGGSAVTGYKI